MKQRARFTLQDFDFLSSSVLWTWMFLVWLVVLVRFLPLSLLLRLPLPSEFIYPMININLHRWNSLKVSFKYIWTWCLVVPAKAGHANVTSWRKNWQNQCRHFHLSLWFIWLPISFSTFNLLVYFTFVTGICTANNCLGRWPWYCHWIIYFHKDEFFLEPFIQWIRFSCFRAQQVFLFQLSASLRFMRLY